MSLLIALEYDCYCILLYTLLVGAYSTRPGLIYSVVRVSRHEQSDRQSATAHPHKYHACLLAGVHMCKKVPGP